MDTITLADITGYNWYYYPMEVNGVKNGNFVPILVLDIDLDLGSTEDTIINFQDKFLYTVPYPDNMKLPVAYYIDPNGDYHIYRHSSKIEVAGIVKAAYMEMNLYDTSDPKVTSLYIYQSDGTILGEAGFFHVNIGGPFYCSHVVQVIHTKDDHYVDITGQFVSETAKALGPSENQKGSVLLSSGSTYTTISPLYHKYTIKYENGIRQILDISTLVYEDNPNDNPDNPDDDGDGDDTDGGDDEHISAVPFDVSGAGVYLYKITTSQLSTILGKFSDSNILDQLKTYFTTGLTLSDIMQSIVGVYQIPISTMSALGSKSVTVSVLDMGVTASYVAQWQDVDFGTVTVSKPTGSFVDTSGYRRIMIHVPWCGIFELDPSEVYGKTLHLYSRINALTGQVFTYLSSGGKTISQYTGNCIIPIPIMGEDWSGIYQGLLSAGVGIAAGVMGAALGGAVGGAETEKITSGVALGNVAVNGANSIVQNSIQSPTFPRTQGGSGGSLSVDNTQAYIIYENRQVVSRNKIYIDTLGLPSGKQTTLNSLGINAYAEVSAVNLGVSGATSEEINIIKDSLMKGVII